METEHHLDRKITAARLERLQLEIEKLKQRDAGISIRKIQALSPIVASVIAAAGFIFGIVKYTQEQKNRQSEQTEARQNELRQEALQRNLDARHALWERQLDLYFQASEAAGTIATTTDDTVRKAAVAKFWALYWGPLSVVEDKAALAPDGEPEVERAMVRFGNLLHDKPGQEDLKQASLELAHVLEKSIGRIWDPMKEASKEPFGSR